ncbi:hypothetical protein GGR52DRAFT_361751 [Hypoxylon sp. FL1284]|nr:hypothetical protein GGR52DRAFT_361751 [Hypoxylon sp. FL1284]
MCSYFQHRCRAIPAAQGPPTPVLGSIWRLLIITVADLPIILWRVRVNKLRRFPARLGCLAVICMAWAWAACHQPSKRKCPEHHSKSRSRWTTRYGSRPGCEPHQFAASSGSLARLHWHARHVSMCEETQDVYHARTPSLREAGSSKSVCLGSFNRIPLDGRQRRS